MLKAVVYEKLIAKNVGQLEAQKSARKDQDDALERRAVASVKDGKLDALIGC
jgi:hypothetical protein